MKYEWKKQEKNLYSAAGSPSLVQCPAQSFVAIRGRGDPNGADFSNRVSALYSLAYAIKMQYKAAAASGPPASGILDFSVYPLEGLWQKRLPGRELVKSELEYTLMIRQPGFITRAEMCAALESVKQKKRNPLCEEIFWETHPAETCVEILHLGPYDAEPASFANMERFVRENGLRRTENVHREIYLSAPNRVEASRRRTILRWRVEEQAGAPAGADGEKG